MKARCYNPNNSQYHNYGARGITVCERWKNSFEAFLADMGPRPSSTHSIDRWPDKNGNYEPGNCRWATSAQQNTNTRTNVVLDIGGGVDAVMSEWCRDLSLHVPTVWQRLKKGMSPREALFKKVRRQQRQRIEIGMFTGSLNAWCKALIIKRGAVRYRIACGYDPCDALFFDTPDHTRRLALLL
jgi:hypothetical protein